MTAVPKVKISLSLAADLVAVVDRSAAALGKARSAVVESWLRESARRARLAQLEADTAAYYDAMTAEEREDDRSWVAAATRSTRKLRIDSPQQSQPRRRK